jgi:hypothetical protein
VALSRRTGRYSGCQFIEGKADVVAVPLVDRYKRDIAPVMVMKQDDTMTSGLSGPRPCHGFRQVRWLNGTMSKHRSRQRRNRPLQVLLHLITAVTAFSARSKEMAIMAAALS